MGKNGSKAQVLIEVVLYTLIAITLMGAVLAFVVPKIDEIRDKATIEQSLKIMQNIDSVILSAVQGGVGNKRVVDLTIKKGSLIINSENDTLVFEMESKYVYSEPGEEISIGGITALTEASGNSHKVTLTSDYGQYNITHNLMEETKTITAAATPYKVTIENNGGANANVNFAVS
jgi:AICAR transformylase/IMP cyclohydrolase PurH